MTQCSLYSVIVQMSLVVVWTGIVPAKNKRAAKKKLVNKVKFTDHQKKEATFTFQHVGYSDSIRTIHGTFADPNRTGLAITSYSPAPRPQSLGRR